MAQSRRKPSLFPVNKYIYLTKGNAKHAETVGKKVYGSVSVYINALISNDRDVKPVLGRWKATKKKAKKK